MITTFFLNIFSNFLTGLFGLLPTGTLSSEVQNALIYITGVMNTFNYFFPIDILFSVLAIAISFELALLLFHFGNWIYGKIRGI